MRHCRNKLRVASQAMEYKAKILAAVPLDCVFEPLMTLYLTDSTSPDDVRAAKAAGIVAYKLYPAGATTNSASGVTDIKKCMSALRAMADVGLLPVSMLRMYIVAGYGVSTVQLGMEGDLTRLRAGGPASAASWGGD